MRALAYGRIRNKQDLPHTRCLEAIYVELNKLIDTYEPDEAVLEGAFFAKNAATAMVLGQARGVVLAVCALRTLPVYEYSPRSIKRAVTGVGSARKEQVAEMVARLLSLRGPVQSDAADALAAAICHVHQRTLPSALRSAPI